MKHSKLDVETPANPVSPRELTILPLKLNNHWKGHQDNARNQRREKEYKKQDKRLNQPSYNKDDKRTTRNVSNSERAAQMHQSQNSSRPLAAQKHRSHSSSPPLNHSSLPKPTKRNAPHWPSSMRSADNFQMPRLSMSDTIKTRNEGGGRPDLELAMSKLQEE
jgi:hypothetical protein